MNLDSLMEREVHWGSEGMGDKCRTDRKKGKWTKLGSLMKIKKEEVDKSDWWTGREGSKVIVGRRSMDRWIKDEDKV